MPFETEWHASNRTPMEVQAVSTSIEGHPREQAPFALQTLSMQSELCIRCCFIADGVELRRKHIAAKQENNKTSTSYGNTKS